MAKSYKFLRALITKRRLTNLNRKTLYLFHYAVQATGAIYVGTFLAAYLFALPSNNILHGEPIYRSVLAIFGGLFLIFILVEILLAYSTKPKAN